MKPPEGHARPRCTFNPSFQREENEERGKTEEEKLGGKDHTKLSCGDVRDGLYLFWDVIDRTVVEAAVLISQQCHNVFI